MSKIGSIGRALVRYFRDRATSVSPKSEATEEDALPWQVTAVTAPDIVSDPIEGMTWNQWCAVANMLSRDGWSFARFAVPNIDGSAHPLFGWLRGSYAIARQHYSCPELAAGGTDETLLVSLFHNRSGIFMGAFVSMDMACEAAEIIERLHFDWSRVRSDPAFNLDRVHEAWRAGGLYLAPFGGTIIGDSSGVTVNVWMKSHASNMAGKPADRKALS